jgi:hypothetical protein
LGGSATLPGKLYQSLQLHNDDDQEKVPGEQRRKQSRRQILNNIGNFGTK